MNEQQKYESWMMGIIKKRTPDGLNVISQVLKAALAQGHVTANDVVDRRYVEPRIIGAVFKLLPSMGFEQDWTRLVKATSKLAHGRMLPTWVLVNRWKAEAMLEKITAIFFDMQGEPTRSGWQGKLF